MRRLWILLACGACASSRLIPRAGPSCTGPGWGALDDHASPSELRRVDRVEVAATPELARFGALAGGSFEPARVERMIDARRRAYVADGYLDATLVARRGVTGPGVQLCVAVQRGPLVEVGVIELVGRTTVTTAELAGHLHAGMFATEAVREAIEQLPARATEVYFDHGLLDAKVGDAKVIRRDGRLDIEIRVSEGAVYTYGEIRASNGSDVPELVRGAVFSRSAVQAARDALARQLVRKVTVLTVIDREARRVDITFAVGAP